MRALVVADLHGQARAIDHLREFAGPEYDAVVLAGDVLQVSPSFFDLDELDPEVREGFEAALPETDRDVRAQADATFAELDPPVLAIPGNADPPDAVSLFARRAKSVHGTAVAVDGVSVAGAGGIPEAPLAVDFPFECGESELASTLADATASVSEPWVLVTHAPPRETLDETEDGARAGSRSVREVVETADPAVHVCGHVHEARGVRRVEGTVVVNPGPLTEGYAAEITVEDGTVDATLLG